MRNQLVHLQVPWMISPSISGFRLTVSENDDARVEVNVVNLSGKERIEEAFIDQRITLTFEDGQWVRTHPPYSDGEIIPPERFDQSKIINPFAGIYTEGFQERFRRLNEAWISSGNSFYSGIYKVEDSDWVKETNASRWGREHYVLKGHDMWIEILARSVSWDEKEPFLSQRENQLK